MPQELRRLKCLLARGVMDTAALWPDIRVGYRWVHQAAHILSHQDQREALTVQQRLGGLLGAMTRHHTAAGTLAPALAHFRKVTRSDWPGLFACSTVSGLPRTNHDLEQFFGAYRYHDRRTTGRKVAAPGWVLNGSVCVIAAAATRLHTYAAAELAPQNVRPGKSCGRPERPAASSGPCVGAFARIPHHISPSWRRTYSSSFCRPRKK